MNIAVIPARGGSKRIPRKNILEFAGKPMISWSIEAALRSKCFDHVVVSTDDEEIASVARICGAEVPFYRPKDLADDHTPTAPVIAHSVEWFEGNGIPVTNACCIYATAPFVESNDILSGLSIISSQSVDFVFPVTSYPYPIQRALRTGPRDQVEMIYPDQRLSRSQDLEDSFHDAGQFYWGTSTAWKMNDSIFTSLSLAIKIPRHRVQDIDTLEDLRRAEIMFNVLRQCH